MKTRVDLSATEPGTSWIAVGGGALVTIGVAALLTPIVSAFLATNIVSFSDAGSAVPVLMALALASLLGGYIAGRIAKHRTAWHGLLSGFVLLLLTGSYVLARVALQRSLFGIDDRFLPDLFPMVLTRGQYHSDPALTLGLIGLPLQLLAAWIGGLFVRPRSAGDPARRVVAAAPEPVLRPPAAGSLRTPTLP